MNMIGRPTLNDERDRMSDSDVTGGIALVVACVSVLHVPDR